MIINLRPAPSDASRPLPPPLVTLIGSADVLLLELQGALTAHGDSAGELIGILALDTHTQARITIQSLPCTSPNVLSLDFLFLYYFHRVGPNHLILANHLPNSCIRQKPTLRIGHHLLQGTIVTLPKPCALIARSRPVLISHSTPSSDHPFTEAEDQAEMDVDNPSTEEPESVNYDILAIVRKKLVFAKRPIPIVPSSMKPAVPGAVVLAPDQDAGAAVEDE